MPAARRKKRGGPAVTESPRPSVSDDAADQRKRNARWALKRAALALAAAAPTVATKTAVWPISAELVEKGLGGVALGLFAFHAVNRRTRVRLEHNRISELKWQLRAEFVLGCVMPLAIVLAAALLEPTWWALLALAIVFAVEHALYEPLQERIHDVVEKEDKRQGTSRFGERRFLRIIGINDDVVTIAGRKPGPGFQRLLTVFIQPGWRAGLSRTRSLILIIMLACSATALGAGGQKVLAPPPRPRSARAEGSR